LNNSKQAGNVPRTRRKLIKSLAVPNPDNCQRKKWSAIYHGPQYYYGFDAGPVARRAIRYHRPLLQAGSTLSQPTALDVGCGEGQDVAFLCENHYRATGLDFVPDAIEKAKQLVAKRDCDAQIFQTDLRDWYWSEKYDLVIAVNSLQFLGNDAPQILEKVIASVAGSGVLGLSLFGCENDERVENGVYFSSLESLLARFSHSGENREWQMLETTNLWQWNVAANAPQPFVTLIAQRLK
jgi:SAM-dependent methyltransferase